MQYLQGKMGRSIGADCAMDQNIYVQTVGAIGVSTPIVNGANQSGSSIITSGWQSGLSTLNAGDIIAFDGRVESYPADHPVAMSISGGAQGTGLEIVDQIGKMVNRL
jgi:hypothetical protein